MTGDSLRLCLAPSSNPELRSLGFGRIVNHIYIEVQVSSTTFNWQLWLESQLDCFGVTSLKPSTSQFQPHSQPQTYLTYLSEKAINLSGHGGK